MADDSPIELYEDNAGFLHVTNGRRVWTFIAPVLGGFVADATAMAAGLDGDWMDALGPLDHPDRPTAVSLDATLVASWQQSTGLWTDDEDMGSAARRYTQEAGPTGSPGRTP